MRPPVAAIMQEMMTIGVILASNSVPPPPVGPNPPAMAVYVCVIYQMVCFGLIQTNKGLEKRRRMEFRTME